MSDQEDMSIGPAEDAIPVSGELGLLRAVKRRDQQELETLREQLLTMTDAAGQALRRLTESERRLEQARATIDMLEHSSSFRFGNALVRSVKSPSQLWRLPRTLWQIGRDLQRRVPAHPRAPIPEKQAQKPSGELPSTLFARAESCVRARGPVKKPASMADLRVAAVMDEFTRACFMPTCRMQSLHSQQYEQQLLDSPPDLLLVESAWRGEADSWRDMIASRSGELLGLLDMCRRRGIPTVFWNKEDPAHFSTFLETARLFDHVFTTDIDSIRRYAAALGHTRIHLLPFASQPRIHNPLIRGSREKGFSFAGSYYHRYPERCEDFDRLILTLAELGPVVIYDRNSERADPSFAFPGRFAAMLRPALPYQRIDEAYKGHRFAVNMNTVKQSQSMFARRVFELMACNTIVVSNYSRGMRSLFGDLVVSTDQADVLRERLVPMITAPQGTRRHRLLALRKVLAQHTYEHRMQQVASAVLGYAPALQSPYVVAVARVGSEKQLATVLDAYERQLYQSRKLIMVASVGVAVDSVPAQGDLVVLRESDASTFDPLQLGPDAFVAVLHPDDYYGPHYLSDLVLATRFSDARVIGKGAFYRCEGERITLREGPRYRDGSPLSRRSSMARVVALAGKSLHAWLDAAAIETDSSLLLGVAVDEFSYCRDGAALVDEAAVVDVDDLNLDAGLDLDRLLERAESLPVQSELEQPSRRDNAVEVNARPADFAACIARSFRLFVADDVVGLRDWRGCEHADAFVCTETATRSFAECAGAQIMQGSERDLRDLLKNNTYGELIVRAPGAALCGVIAEQVRVCSVKVHLGANDVRGADAGTPWVALLAQRFPRLSLFVDPDVDRGLLRPLVGALEIRPWLTA